MTNIKIATRKSQLALWQANTVKGLLIGLGFDVELFPLVTTGDKLQTGALSEKNVTDAHAHLTTGKGLFVREIQHALLNQDAHVAVHSMKDLPVAKTPGLFVPALLPRADVRDVIVVSPRLLDWLHQNGVPSLANMSFDKLCELLKACPHIREGQGIGTTSARRQLLTKKFFGSDVAVNVLRGNVDTRLGRVRNNEFSAILLAKAGLDRLGLFSDRDMCALPANHFIPAPAQGAVAVEMPVTLKDVASALAKLNRNDTMIPVMIERWGLKCVGGDCHMAIALHCTDALTLYVGWQKEAHERFVQIDLSLFNGLFQELIQKFGSVSYDAFANAFEKSHAARFVYDHLKSHGVAVVDGLV